MLPFHSQHSAGGVYISSIRFLKKLVICQHLSKVKCCLSTENTVAIESEISVRKVWLNDTPPNRHLRERRWRWAGHVILMLWHHETTPKNTIHRKCYLMLHYLVDATIQVAYTGLYWFKHACWCYATRTFLCNRVKSGKFGRSAKFGQRHCSFHILIIGIKNKWTKQTVKILMRRLIWIYTVCKGMSEFTWCPKLPDLSLCFRLCYCRVLWSRWRLYTNKMPLGIPCRLWSHWSQPYRCQRMHMYSTW